MHMADALLSPTVGGAMWGAAAAVTAFCSHRVRQNLDERRIPLMGVLAAFVFAAQMINFTIPGTGSSGHLGGGLLLAVLLGPQAAFLALTSVLTVQALFFADGGLLALGCNIINLGLFPCFIGYPLIYRKLAGRRPTTGRLLAASLAAAVIGLQLGSLAVVVETTLSGIAALPFSSFALVMQPIHLAIGLVEGLVTAGIVSFIRQARPEALEESIADPPLAKRPLKPLLVGLALAAACVGGLLSWYGSELPDGLEWSIARVAGGEVAPVPSGTHQVLEGVQEKTAFLPDYGLKPKEEEHRQKTGPDRLGTSVAGLVGGLLVLLLGVLAGLALKKRGAGSGRVRPQPSTPR